MARTLTPAEARALYDRLGARQDWQAFYENPAIEALIAKGDFGGARAVCEFGCGTGRLAHRLLARELPADATYLGLDLSDTMVHLARGRLQLWSKRAHVVRTDGSPRLPVADGRADRVLSTYVLDLLSAADIRAFLAEAHRVLGPGGLLCLISLTHGRTRPSRLVTLLWRRVHDWRPALLGGCRPLELKNHVFEPDWCIRHCSVVTSFGVSSEIVVAARR